MATDRMAGSPPFGTFDLPGQSRRLRWSDDLFAVFGFEVAEVVPTLDLMAAHLHPEDRAGWLSDLERVLADGGTFCRWHRIVDARRRIRTTVTNGEATLDGSGLVSGVRGTITDLTDTLRQHQGLEVTRAVQLSAATRALIDQAKGVLMVVFDLDETQAFDLLRWHSSHSNTKLRDVAAILVERLTDPALAGVPPRQRLTTILAGLVDGSTPRPSSRPVEPAESPHPLPGLIPTADLPHTMLFAVSGAAQSITISDCLQPDQPLVYVNSAFLELTGYSAEEIIGRNCRFLQGPDTDRAQVRAVRAALDEGLEVRTVLRNYRRDGTGFWNELHLSGVRDSTGRLTHFIGYQVDVSERVEREQQLERLAYTDARTGLPNEAAALRRLAVLSETGGSEPMLTYVGVGGFRSADGHDDPDTVQAVLTNAAKWLGAAVPTDAFLAKLADDGFLVIAPGATDPLDLSDALTQLAEHSPADQRIWTTVGTARHPDGGVEPSALIEAARAAAQR